MSKGGGVAELITLKQDSPLPEWIKNKSVRTAKEIGVSDIALRKAVRGETLRGDVAAKIAAYFKMGVARLFDTVSADKPLAPSNIHSAVTCLSSIFQSAYKAGIMRENPIRRTTPPRREGKATEGVFLAEEQARLFRSLLDAQPQGTYKAACCTSGFAVVSYGLYTGIVSR